MTITTENKSGPPMKVAHHIEDDEQWGRLIVTDEPFPLTIDDGQNTYVVPVGFVSDGMSVPRFLWGFLAAPDDPVVLPPSLSHDWLYYKHVCTRREADMWYFKALRYNGYPLWKSVLTYIGVRLFGRPHFTS